MGPKKMQYIPGLTQRPDDSEFPVPEPEETEDDILIREFLKGKKNPTMCLHEYCSRNRMQLDFREEAAEHRPGYIGRFGIRVIIDGQSYLQGVGQNKKEARNEASRLAFRALVGLDDFVPVEEKSEESEDRFLEVRRLRDLCKERDLIYNSSVDVDPDGLHRCVVAVAGQDQVVEKGPDKDRVILAAHSQAIVMLGEAATAHVDTLYAEGAFPALEMPVLAPNPEIAQKRQDIVYETFELRLQLLPPYFSQMEHKIAAFFLCSSQGGVGELVALGTGSCSIAAEHVTVDGRSLLDSTCLTVARRSLLRYLAQEMLNLHEGKSSIFMWAPDDSNKMQLADGMSLHLYLSHPPDGDYQDFLEGSTSPTPEEQQTIDQGGHLPTFTNDLHGMLKCRTEKGVVEMTHHVESQTSLALVKEKNEIRVMSQSDKLLHWNIVGLQGAALSLFTHPIYLSSISLGFHPQNNHGHLCRALCCRVYNELSDELPAPYRISHPVLQFCPRRAQLRLSHLYSQQSNISINWNCYDSLLELVDGDKGRTNEISPFKVSRSPGCASRLCKTAMHMKWFMDLCKAERRGKAEFFRGKTPADVKAAASDYQLSSRAFVQHCEHHGVGKWMHVPPEVNYFMK
ncbi:adenosine deaminase domain-containing protein 1 [Aplysia californica]|uniref:Adenosine deaminase domain-containing protein 1 n=1 Tax=Aplysia californica TaxID=6500 RepID=A0ABM0K817_APLCA|nr:adenosine deaminase domain-containing protein 1 [Aplysia californica]